MRGMSRLGLEEGVRKKRRGSTSNLQSLVSEFDGRIHRKGVYIRIRGT